MKSEDLYHQLFEASPSAILTVDRDGHVIDCNRAACVHLARARSELLGTPVLRWIQPADRPRCKSYFLQAFQGGTVEWKARVQRGDGMQPLLVFRTVVPGASAEPDRLNVFLREAGESRPGRPDGGQLQSVLENVPGQFVLVLDTTGRIRYSSGLSRTLWYDDDECLGRDPAFLFARGGAGRGLIKVMLREAQAGRRWEGTPWMVRKDGSQFPARAFAVPYRDPRTEAVVGVLLVGRDDSREHEAREALDRAERMASIGEVVVSVAREMRAPLDRLAAQRDALRERLARNGGHADAPELDALSSELAHVERLVDALLAFAVETRGPGDDSDTAALLEEAIREQVFVFEDAGIEIETAVSRDLPTTYVAPEHFRKLLRHILTNAREAAAGRRGGRVRVRAQRTGAGFEVHVHDNGRGLRDDWAERIFEPFFTTKTGHLGLGLAVARGIVKAYGGRIWASRSQDGWTTISIALPSEPPAYTSAFRPVPLVLRRARSVLVVDDDEGIRTVIRTFLEKLGYTVAEAWSGRSALARLTSGEPPELVITDLKMKDGTGYWFLNELAKDFPQILRRTVILTGDPSHAAVDRIVKETGCPVVRKPFDFHVLLDRLDEVSLRG